MCDMSPLKNDRLPRREMRDKPESISISPDCPVQLMVSSGSFHANLSNADDDLLNITI